MPKGIGRQSSEELKHSFLRLLQLNIYNVEAGQTERFAPLLMAGNAQKDEKKLRKVCSKEKKHYLCTAFREMLTAKSCGDAEIAQLVEHNLAKVGVAGPSPVFRSTF